MSSFIPKFHFKIIYIENFCSTVKDRRMAPSKMNIKAKQILRKIFSAQKSYSKQLTDLERHNSHITSYTNKLAGYLSAYYFMRNHYIKCFPLANIYMGRIKAVKRTAVNTRTITLSLTYYSTPCSKYLMKYNLYHTINHTKHSYLYATYLPRKYLENTLLKQNTRPLSLTERPAI